MPGHFPSDTHGLAAYDGSALYEYADPREGYHQDWNTLIYNYGRNEVKNFLSSNALYWLERFGLDGIRVDAVASMIYRDYSRAEGEWIPNQYGGRENLEAIEFLKHTNWKIHSEVPGAISIAEESTSFGGVTHPTENGGLGFNFKWNMGWMNDTLSYMKLDPVYRRYHHDKMTFGMIYQYSENFVLPLSHDEVVHANVRYSVKCRVIHGKNSRIYVPIMVICGAIQARNYYSWVMNLLKVVNGIMKKAWIGFCLTKTMVAYGIKAYCN